MTFSNICLSLLFISPTNFDNCSLNAVILLSVSSNSSFATSAPDVPPTTLAPIRRAPSKTFLAALPTCSAVLTPSSALVSSLIILETIFIKDSSGLDNREYSQELIQICLYFFFLSSSPSLSAEYIELIREVLPLPHSPCIPIVIGVSVSLIYSMRESACIDISR